MNKEFSRPSLNAYFFRRGFRASLGLFYVFIFITVSLTAYLYGLIEIDSQRVIIRILPTNLNSNEAVIFNKNYNNKKIVIHGDEIDTLNDNDYISDLLKRDLKKKSLKNSIFIEKQFFFEPGLQLEIEKNITKLFGRIERFKYQIQTLLKPTEALNVADLKFKYDNLIKDKQNKLKEELREELKRKKNNPDFSGFNDTLDDEYEDISTMTKLDENHVVTRDIIIRFLKYEKSKRKLKKSVQTIKSLLNRFDLKKELDLNDLPKIWHKYFLKINEFQLFNDTNSINEVLKSMSTSSIVSCVEKEKGTQIKLLLLLADGTDVLVKPMKVTRDYETPPDHFYFVDFERHHAEIAAFHVDMLLGFYRVPPTVGRVFNMTGDLWDKADSELAKTFFYSPAGNVCFTGHCSYYCDTTHAICGRPFDRMEGSVQLLLPSKPLVQWKIVSHPYRRTYNKKKKKAEWEMDDKYCVDTVFQDINFQSKILLDIIDMSVFDFITGNMDRHHFERMISLSNDTFSLHLDNGRAFGKQFYDEMSILAPLKQCCLIRYSTFLRLKHLHKKSFSKLLDESLKNDPLYPILTENHLKAVDRRLLIILNELYSCVNKYITTEVFVDDGY